MQDLEIANKRLKQENLTLSIVKNNKRIFDSVLSGISGFLEAIEKLEDRLEGASVADKTVGRAIALLCVYTKVKAVYAIMLSEKGKAVFEEYAVYHEWENSVESILDKDEVGICPFEKLATEISDPAEAYKKLKALQHSFSARQNPVL